MRTLHTRTTMIGGHLSERAILGTERRYIYMGWCRALIRCICTSRILILPPNYKNVGLQSPSALEHALLRGRKKEWSLFLTIAQAPICYTTRLLSRRFSSASIIASYSTGNINEACSFELGFLEIQAVETTLASSSI